MEAPIPQPSTSQFTCGHVCKFNRAPHPQARSADVCGTPHDEIADWRSRRATVLSRAVHDLAMNRFASVAARCAPLLADNPDDPRHRCSAALLPVPVGIMSMRPVCCIAPRARSWPGGSPVS